MDPISTITRALFLIISARVGEYDLVIIGSFVKFGYIIAFYGFYRHKNW
jgi:hypothetical protein